MPVFVKSTKGLADRRISTQKVKGIFIYKNCISFTKADFRRQKWHLAYKYSVFNLQSSVLVYKLASRISIQPGRPVPHSQILNNNKILS